MDVYGFQVWSILEDDVPWRDRLADCRAAVLGVGAIGRQVSLQLASIGVPSLQLIDHDTIEAVNLGCQAYLESDLGRPKAQADQCQLIKHGLEVDELTERFPTSTQVGSVMFCCVDSIQTWQLIWIAGKDDVQFFKADAQEKLDG